MINTTARTKRRVLAAILLGFLAVVVVAADTVVARDDVDDSTIRGHVALDKGQYRAAADHFKTAAQQAESQKVEAEALYWQAFALHRIGGKRELRAAAENLVALQDLEMGERLLEEARALAVRVKAELAQQGDATAARELAESMEKQQDLQLKMAALQAMMHMNPERSLPVLQEIMRKREPGTAELRRQAIFLLSQGGADKASDTIIEAARNDPDPEVREQAMFWLGQTGSDEAMAFFRDVIRDERNPEVVEHAMFALSQFDSEEANLVLREIAGDSSRPNEVREMAIFGLGHNGTPDDRQFLRGMYNNLENDEMREQVLFAVAQHDDPGTADWLVDIAMDDTAGIESRKMALFWAGQRGLLPVSRLDGIYTKVEDQEMRQQIIFVLSQDDSEEAAQQLMSIARSEQDIELRKQAVFWIGQSNAEGVEDFLLEIISE